MEKEKSNRAVDSRLLFFNSLREKFKRPLLPDPPAPPTAVREPVERQMGLAEYIAVKRRGEAR